MLLVSPAAAGLLWLVTFQLVMKCHSGAPHPRDGGPFVL